MSAYYFPGAPPGKNGDGQGWLALTVVKMAGEHVFRTNISTAALRARWLAFSGLFRPLRWTKGWFGVPA